MSNTGSYLFNDKCEGEFLQMLYDHIIFYSCGFPIVLGKACHHGRSGNTVVSRFQVKHQTLILPHLRYILFHPNSTCLFSICSNKYFPELHDNVPTLNYYVTPVVAIVIGTYFITSSFFGVYEMAVDTLFLCFLEGNDIKKSSA